MVPEEQIGILENVLRDLIERVLSTNYGADWLSHLKIGEERLALWAERREEESKRRPGVSVDPRLLFYSEFTDLASIIDKHWDDGFIECFRDKKRIQLDLRRLLGYRNPGAHSRPLVMPWEQDLVSGLTGLIRNEVTIYLSEKAMTEDEPDFFARIEEVIDHFGNRYVGKATDGRGSGTSSQRLYVGDILTLQCRGADPQGKELYWDMHTLGAVGQNFRGDTGRLDYKITDAAVGVSTAFLVHLRCLERPYSRLDMQDDDLLILRFRVDPHR
jgi:hypothetical protein